MVVKVDGVVESSSAHDRYRLSGEETDDWGITAAEREHGVEQLREALINAGYLKAANFDFFMLLRFLRARDYEVDKATEMLIQHLQWRREFGTDTIIEDFDFKERTQFLAVYPQGYHKTDKQGRPIYIQHLGSIDLKKITQVTSKERMIRFHVQEWERCIKSIFPACSQKAGRRIDQMFAIMDVSGVGVHMLSADVRATLKEITNIDQDNYPESLGKVFIINAPFVFKAVWAFIQPLLNPRTRAKIELYGKNYLPELLKHVDMDSIPQYLGGTSNKTLIDDVGPWNEALYVSGGKETGVGVGVSSVENREMVPLILKSPRPPEYKRAQSPVNDSVIDQELTTLKSNNHDKKGDEESGFYTPRQSSFTDTEQHSRRLTAADSSLMEGLELQLVELQHMEREEKKKGVSLVERVRRLEEFLKPRASTSKLYLQDSSISQEEVPLISRVEHLEQACEIVLIAEESRLSREQEESKEQVGGVQKGHRQCCGGCSIM